MSARLAEVQLPNWPILMDEATGSAYLGVGAKTFRALTSRYKIQPVDVGFRMLRWRRPDLDRLVDSLPLQGATIPADVANAPESFDDALKRAKKRGRR